jgi:hypothetical protein
MWLLISLETQLHGISYLINISVYIKGERRNLCYSISMRHDSLTGRSEMVDRTVNIRTADVFSSKQKSITIPVPEKLHRITVSNALTQNFVRPITDVL